MKDNHIGFFKVQSQNKSYRKEKCNLVFEWWKNELFWCLLKANIIQVYLQTRLLKANSFIQLGFKFNVVENDVMDAT